MEGKEEKIFYDSKYNEENGPTKLIEWNPKISSNTLTGTPSPKTMRLYGKIGNDMIVILVDLERTHNYIEC